MCDVKKAIEYGDVKNAIEYALYFAKDHGTIKSWYYNGKYHVTTKTGTFTIDIKETDNGED